jgi:hypothetical protein
MQAGDCPWRIEELATGHTKTITITPPNPAPPNFFEPISLSNISTHLGKLIPGCQRSAQMSYDSPINQENSLLLTISKPHPLNQPQTDQHFSSTNHTYLLNPVL